jgi:hypothetical protein
MQYFINPPTRNTKAVAQVHGFFNNEKTAENKRFELLIPFRVYTLSKRAP